MRSEIADKQRLLHIADAINEIEKFIAGLEKESFVDNSLVRSAVVFQLAVIGEAVNHLSESVKSLHTDIDWKAIKGFSNVAAHEYLEYRMSKFGQ